MDSPHLIKEGKNRAAPWADLQAAFLAVMEELDNVKSTCVCFFFTDSWAMENWTSKRMPCKEGSALWKSLWEFMGHSKVGHAVAHHKNPLSGSGGKCNVQVHLLEWPPGSMK